MSMENVVDNRCKKETEKTDRHNGITGTELRYHRPPKALPVTESVALPPNQGKQHVTTSSADQSRQNQGSSMPEVPSIDDALRYHTDTSEFRTAHFQMR
jgi:hypothetical protein